MLTPASGDLELVNKIIRARESKPFDPVQGYGHAIVPPDKWVTRKKEGTRFDFYGGNADQGLCKYSTHDLFCLFHIAALTVVAFRNLGMVQCIIGSNMSRRTLALFSKRMWRITWKYQSRTFLSWNKISQTSHWTSSTQSHWWSNLLHVTSSYAILCISRYAN